SELVLLHEVDELLEAHAASAGDGAQRDCTPKHGEKIERDRRAAQLAEEDDRAADACRGDRLRQERTADDVDEQHNTASFRRGAHALGPIRVVDLEDVGAELQEDVPRRAAAKERDHTRTRSARELRDEERYATASRDGDGAAAREAPGGEERLPCGHAGD